MTIRARAPLRISFAGGGTDVPPFPQLYGGAVISTTIDRYAYVTIRNNSSKGLRVISQDFGLLETFQNISELKVSGKTSLIKGALLQSNINKKNIDVIIHVDSAPGSGLGSSSALAVALIGCIYKYMKKTIKPKEIAQNAIELERNIVGIPGGLQDQYASSFGGFNLIRFNNKVTVKPIKIHPSVTQELLASTILIDTKKTRISGHIIKNQVKLYEKKDKDVITNLKKIKDMTFEFQDHLMSGNIPKLGILLNQYWMIKRKITKQITNTHIDKIYSKMIASGAYGGKLLGAGGGGHMLFLCDPDKKHELLKKISKLNTTLVKFNFDFDGLQTWKVTKDQVKP